MTPEDRDALVQRAAHTRLRLPRERHVLLRLVGGEPVDAVICASERAARAVALAAGLKESDFRIVVGREM